MLVKPFKTVKAVVSIFAVLGIGTFLSCSDEGEAQSLTKTAFS